MNWIILCPYGNSMPTGSIWNPILLLLTSLGIIYLGGKSAEIILRGNTTKKEKIFVALAFLFIAVTFILNIAMSNLWGFGVENY